MRSDEQLRQQISHDLAQVPQLLKGLQHLEFGPLGCKSTRFSIRHIPGALPGLVSKRPRAEVAVSRTPR